MIRDVRKYIYFQLLFMDLFVQLYHTGFTERYFVFTLYDLLNNNNLTTPKSSVSSANLRISLCNYFPTSLMLSKMVSTAFPG